MTIPVINDEMKKAATRALDNEILVGGESVSKFEEDFAKYIGTDYAVSTNSGSSALLLTYSAIGMKNGEKIIAPSATFVATVNSACILGAVPLFCEIGNDYVISPESLEIMLKRRQAKCVIPVHLYGYPCDMFSIKEIAQKKNVIIVEDAAQAHGAQLRNYSAGSFGEAAIFSFYPTKNMTVAGDGGMITTNNKRINDFALKMRDVGRKTKYIHDKMGYTLRLNSVNASIGRIQLKYLDTWNEKRRNIAARYQKKLKDISDLILPPEDKKSSKSVYHMYVIRTKKRNLLGAWLDTNGISTGIHYPLPVHKQPAYRKFPKSNLPFTEEWSRSVLSIPIHPNLSIKEQQFVIDTIIRFFNERLYKLKEIRDKAELWSARLI